MERTKRAWHRFAADMNCNPDYHGGMICRKGYPGDSACTRFGGKMLCLKDVKTDAKRDWILVASDRAPVMGSK